jgi:hypothetical protein
MSPCYPHPLTYYSADFSLQCYKTYAQGARDVAEGL